MLLEIREWKNVSLILRQIYCYGNSYVSLVSGDSCNILVVQRHVYKTTLYKLPLNNRESRYHNNWLQNRGLNNF